MQETEINVKYLHWAIKSEDMICFCLLVIKKMFALCPHGVELIDQKDEMIEKASGTHVNIL